MKSAKQDAGKMTPEWILLKEYCVSCGRFADNAWEVSMSRYAKRGNYCDMCNQKATLRAKKIKNFIPEKYFREIMDDLINNVVDKDPNRH